MVLTITGPGVLYKKDITTGEYEKIGELLGDTKVTPDKEIKHVDHSVGKGHDNLEQCLVNMLDKANIFYERLPNKQYKIDTLSIWAGSMKWYDSNTGERGKGLNSFMDYLVKSFSVDRA